MKSFLKKNKTIIIVLLLLVLAYYFFHKSKFGDEGNSGIYGDSGIYSGSGNNNNVYIFYAPWCGYCKKSMDVFEQLVDTYGSNNVRLINSEDSDSSSLMQEYSVNSFPTITSSTRTKYSGDRSYDDLSRFVRMYLQN